jgi:GTPase
MAELFKAIHKAYDSATRVFSTAEVTKAVEIAVGTYSPPVVRGHVAKLKYGHPGDTNPPTFIIHGNRLRTLPDSYRRYLENFFRKRFKLVGTPIRFVFKDSDNPYEGKKNVLTDRQVEKRKRLIRHHKRK